MPLSSDLLSGSMLQIMHHFMSYEHIIMNISPREKTRLFLRDKSRKKSRQSRVSNDRNDLITEVAQTYRP